MKSSSTYAKSMEIQSIILSRMNRCLEPTEECVDQTDQSKSSWLQGNNSKTFTGWKDHSMRIKGVVSQFSTMDKSSNAAIVSEGAIALEMGMERLAESWERRGERSRTT